MHTTDSDVDRTRTRLAWFVIALGIVAITVVSYVAMTTAAKSDRTEISRMVFAAVLPLMGTWVGAVLAYYFSRDNLQAGSETAINAISAGRTAPLDDDTQVTSVMTPLNRIKPREEVADEAAAGALTLASLNAKLTASGMSRIPVLRASGKQSALAYTPLYVVHEADIHNFAQRQGTSASAFLPVHTVANLLAEDDLKKELIAFATVRGTATLAETRAELAKTPHGKDVFVTTDGSRAGEVIGWLTNSDLARST